MAVNNQPTPQVFEGMPLPRAVLTLSLPTVASSLVMVLYSLADTCFVGLLGDPVQNAAVTLAAPVLLAFNAVNNLFGVGASSMMSRALGRGAQDEVRTSAAVGFYSAAFCAAAFSLLYLAFRRPFLGLLGANEATRAGTADYLFYTVALGAVPSIINVVLAYFVRAEGASLHASIGTMSGCFLNIALDPLFILPGGFGMGAAGAGLATLLSNTAACLYFFLLLARRRGKTFISLNPRRLARCGRVLRGVCAVGVPAAVQNLLNVTGMTVLNRFTAAFGPAAVAAMGIAHKVSMVPVQVALGFSQGIMPLVGYTFASGNRPRMKRAVLLAGRMMTGFMLAVTALLYAFAAPLSALFMRDATVVAIAAPLLRGMSFSLPFLCLDFLGVGVFQACGMGKNALFFALLRKIVLEIPALFLLNRLFPLYGLAYAQLAAETVLAAASLLVLHSLFRKPRL